MNLKKQRQEDAEAEERNSPSGTIVYKAILKAACDELERPSSALFWSGLAAGLSMGASLVAEGLLGNSLPDALGSLWLHAIAHRSDPRPAGGAGSTLR